MHNTPTIVAPGGSYEKAMVASRYGAEEVYVGVPFTSLRMRQNKIYNFDDLKKTVDDLHKNGSKALLTMNIFPRNTDIKIFEQTVKQIANVGADAIIFSDPGTFHIIKKYLPNTPLHLSTQSSTMNYAAVQFWKDMGVKRIVFARELNLEEIKEIREKVPGMEIEVFVHGAMCMSYSGRCLLGDYMSGRPGNKGECSHACRFKYKVWLEEERRPGKLFQLEGDESGSHILSSKDLCTIERLEEIIPYVDAIKIEGRSKSEFYVGAVVKAYKHVRDAIIANTKIDKKIANLVNVIPHREYREGFLFNKLSKFPEGEETSENKEKQTSISYDSAGPLFNRNYFGMFSDQYREKDGKKYFHIEPKEVITPGMKIKYLSPTQMGVVEILAILDSKGNQIEKAHCNSGEVYILTNKILEGREILYE
ncbi:MAG TPA: peptidase U32 family protein [Candidatus Absconditabacterales bacterium]|nr:peptidase U32 family protein [Candidatus Absconditabacterales bacterium]